MNLETKPMTKQEQIKALAELDGIEIDISPYNWRWRYKDCSWNAFDLPDYLTSYDAIIPLIQKQNDFDLIDLEMWIEDQNKLGLVIYATPAQLCEALLRATGKWKQYTETPPCKHSYREDSTVCEICGT